VRVIGAALTADLLAVLVFAATGRSSHAEALDPAGLAGTAAPFLAGLLVGWAAGRLWRAPVPLVSGMWAFGGAAVVGLALRGLVTGRLPVTFVLVTCVSLALLLLGWRAVAAGVVRRRRSSI
jgi:Protein of unknown function (DUF3054)